MTISRLFAASTLALCCSLAALPVNAQINSPDELLQKVQSDIIKEEMRPRIQIALLLDTSNSMDGLIMQAKSQLWMLVNGLAEGEKYGKKPLLELALYEYGNNDLSVANGYVRQVLSLTNDLDAVSEKLFSLKTNGGQEYAGTVIDTALDELEWSGRSDDMKLIIIAGNEPFTQGPISYETACARARKNGVLIDTIHCGDEDTGIKGMWKAGADCGGGLYMTINQDEKIVHVASPYDDQLLELNKKLNDTYFGYGTEGLAMKERQAAQDTNAESVGKRSIINRLSSKSSSAYRNDKWDIVDAYEVDKDRILELSEEELPEELKGKSTDERIAFVEAKKTERGNVQTQIADLENKRQSFVAKKRKEMTATKTLDNVMVDAVRKQALENGFSY
jgi:hypothetical protein